MRNIYNYISSIATALVVSMAVQAQSIPSDSIVIPLWQGIEIEADMVPLVTNFLYDSKTFRYEAAGRVNLQNKYFPVLEIGYEGHQRELTSGINYHGSGMYYRLGVDLNVIRKVSITPVKNKFMAGVRLGFSDFDYDLMNVKINNPYAGQINYTDLMDQQHTALWFEFVAGIRIAIFKQVTLGWTVRIKNPLGEPQPGIVTPWHIPGYGIAGGSVWAFNYMIGYQF